MLKRETRKETENNENLTSVHVRIEDSIQTNTKQMETDSDRLDHLQLELVKTAKFNEQEQREFDSVNRVCTVDLARRTRDTRQDRRINMD